MSLSFNQLTSLWKEDKRRWVKPSTYAEYVQVVNRHILPFFYEMELSSITDACVQQFADSLITKGLNINTVKDIIMVLKMILRFGARQGFATYTDFQVHFPAGMERKMELSVLSSNEQKVLLRYLQEHFSFRNLGILICLHTGLRIGEICGLQWKNLDTGAGIIHITKTVQRIWLSDGGEKINQLSVHSPKTITSERDIPMSSAILKIVRPLRKITNADFYVVSNSPEPLEPRYYRDYFKKLQDKLGLRHFRFHALRHSFATRCIESKCDYKTVSVILGHASISTTMDLYVHPGYEEKKKVIEKMARAMV